MYVKLYTDCESEDGYLRDGCVWAENTNIYDTMSVTVKYANGVLMSYTANTYLPYEGQAIAFNGTKGRLDYRSSKAVVLPKTNSGLREVLESRRSSRTWPREEKASMADQILRSGI